MKSYRYLHYDVFTDHLFGGNQLAVVLDGRGLSAETMQAIAMEMNFSETTFVLPPETPGTDVRMRIFTPGEELPMAGHPTIGTTFALARTGVIDCSRSGMVFGCDIGPVPVVMTWNAENLAFVWMSQLLPTFGQPIPDPARTAAALSLPQAAVAGTGHPVQVVSCGVPFLFVPLTTRSAVDSVVVNRQALSRSIAPPSSRRTASSCSRRTKATAALPFTAGCLRPAWASAKIRRPAGRAGRSAVIWFVTASSARSRRRRC